MGDVSVDSHTQRIVVGRNGALKIVYAGPPGPSGEDAPPSTLSATGNVSDPSQIWVMIHNLHYKPAGWQFFAGQDCTGEQMDPESITDISDDVSSASWHGPVPGSWKAS